ncbi:MAG: LysR family transcriptional regulator [Gammaproteobacteria bacterium]|nr:MAG: LysR family transcriptional regulator [Gammaproteobacteria bacterium]
MAARPNYHHLYRFWIVAQEGSLAGASRLLGVRHSTLSAQLASLEAALGTRLFLRRSRGVRLTPQGEVVASYCEQIFRLGFELVEAVSGQREGRLRVAMLASVPRSLFYAALRPVFGSKNTVRIEVSVGGLDAMCRALIAGTVHVLITDRLPPRASAGPIHAHLIGETRIGIYGTARLAGRYREGFPRSLDGAPLLLPSAGGVLREGLDSWFAEEGIRPRIVGELDDVPLMNGFASRGHGLVPIRQALAEEAKRRDGLLQLGTVPGLVDRLYALTLGRRVRHPAIQRLIDSCRAGMAWTAP